MMTEQDVGIGHRLILTGSLEQMELLSDDMPLTIERSCTGWDLQASGLGSAPLLTFLVDLVLVLAPADRGSAQGMAEGPSSCAPLRKLYANLDMPGSSDRQQQQQQ